MIRNLKYLGLLVAVLLTIFGCATDVHVSTPAPDKKVLDGIPFWLSKPHILKLYKKSDVGYVLVNESRQVLPDRSRLFVLHLDGYALADGTLDVMMRGDGTLKTVEIRDAANKADEALTNTAQALEKIATKKETIETAKETEKEEEKTAFEGKLDAEVTAFGLKLDAEGLQEAYDNLPDDTAPDVRRQKRIELIKAKVEANKAYKKLGKEPPFGDITFP